MLGRTFIGRGRLSSLLVATLLLGGGLCALPAHATLIQVDYLGYVRSIQGNGAGFVVGDAIFGRMLIDTSKVSATECFVGDCTYTGAELVSGDLIPPGQQSHDLVNISDAAGPACSSPCDNFFIRNGFTSLIGSLEFSRSNFIWAHDDVTDFINGTGLEQYFELQTADITQNGIMFGRLTESIVDTLGTFSSFNEAMYILTSLQVSPIPVPASDVAPLLGVGLIVTILTARRRRRAR